MTSIIWMLIIAAVALIIVEAVLLALLRYWMHQYRQLKREYDTLKSQLGEADWREGL